MGRPATPGAPGKVRRLARVPTIPTSTPPDTQGTGVASREQQPEASRQNGSQAARPTEGDPAEQVVNLKQTAKELGENGRTKD